MVAIAPISATIPYGPALNLLYAKSLWMESAGSPVSVCDYDTLLELAGVSRAPAARAADEEPDRRRGWKR